VPGCGGEPSSSDYCVKKVPGALIERGNNGYPSANFPLGKCEGDCDNDGECAGNLKCFQRDGRQPVPGCEGLGNTGSDYCYAEIEYVGNNGGAGFPLGDCEG
jgi:hypothetical protein